MGNKNDNGEAHDLAAHHPEVILEMKEVLNNARTPLKVSTFEQKTYLENG